jgi:hypothetical protein
MLRAFFGAAVEEPVMMDAALENARRAEGGADVRGGVA